VIVFNNRGYSTERFILDGPFNDISPWRFDRLGEVFGPLRGFSASTEDEFEDALVQAFAEQAAPSLINVHLSRMIHLRHATAGRASWQTDLARCMRC